MTIIPIYATVSVLLQLSMNKLIDPIRSSNAAVVTGKPFNQDSISKDNLTRTIEDLKKSFVQLLSDDLGEKQAWGLSYSTQSGTALMVKSLDVFRYSKSDVAVVEIAPNKEIAVIKNQWKHLNLAPIPIILNEKTILLPPVEGTFWATLLYPSKSGEVRQSKVNLSVTKAEYGKLVMGRTAFQVPADCVSGVGILVNDLGKYTPVSLESSETGDNETTSLVWALPLPIDLRDIRGLGVLNPVEPLTNVNAVSILVGGIDETGSITKAIAKEYAMLFLKEECPRLLQTTDIDSTVATSQSGLQPKNKVERQSILNVLGQYSKIANYTLVVWFLRRRDGFVMVQCKIAGRAVTNGGETNVTLYDDIEFNSTKLDETAIRDSIKKLMKSLSDKWISANPRDN